MCQIINNRYSIILILKDTYTDIHMLMLYLLTVSHNSHVHLKCEDPPYWGGPPWKPKFIIPLFPQKPRLGLGNENLTSDKILTDGGLAQYLHSSVG